jgi:hypothetical protein
MKITSDLTNLTTAILILTVQMFIEWTLLCKICVSIVAILQQKKKRSKSDLIHDFTPSEFINLVYATKL